MLELLVCTIKTERDVKEFADLFKSLFETYRIAKSNSTDTDYKENKLKIDFYLLKKYHGLENQ